MHAHPPIAFMPYRAAFSGNFIAPVNRNDLRTTAPGGSLILTLSWISPTAARGSQVLEDTNGGAWTKGEREGEGHPRRGSSRT